MYYALAGLVVGFLIPYIARRFAKFMPATPGYALWQMVCPTKRVSSAKIEKSLAYGRLRRDLFYRAVSTGLLTMVIAYGAYLHWGTLHLVWILAYVFILLLLAEIDYRMYLLPDILTVPLLICGFAVSTFGLGWVDAPEAAMGAVAGYVLPVAVSLLFVWRHKDAFGGGDIKLLAAVGAWLGAEKLLYVIIISTVLFLIWAMVRRRRDGAYGPAIALSALIVAFYFF